MRVGERVKEAEAVGGRVGPGFVGVTLREAFAGVLLPLGEAEADGEGLSVPVCCAEAVAGEEGVGRAVRVTVEVAVGLGEGLPRGAAGVGVEAAGGEGVEAALREKWGEGEEEGVRVGERV